MRKKDSGSGKAKKSLPVRILAVFAVLSVILTSSGFQALVKSEQESESTTKIVEAVTLESETFLDGDEKGALATSRRKNENETKTGTETKMGTVPVYGDGQLVYENDTYKVVVDYTAETQIPANARLEAVQAVSGDEVYQNALEQIIWQKKEADPELNPNTVAADVWKLSIIGTAETEVDKEDDVQPTVSAEVDGQMDAEVASTKVDGQTNAKATADERDDAQPIVSVKASGQADTEIQPAAPLQVTITAKERDESAAEGTLEVRHLGELGQALALDEQNTVSFMADTLTGFAFDWVKEQEIIQTVTTSQVEITATYPRSAFPTDVQLQAVLLSEDNGTDAEELAAYDEIVTAEAVNQGLNAANWICFDIRFLDADGIKIEPNDKVKISMYFITPKTGKEITYVEAETENVNPAFLVLDPEDNEWKAPKEEEPLAETKQIEEAVPKESQDSQWLLLHLPDNGGVENLTDEISTQINTNEENALVKAEFVSGEFSKFIYFKAEVEERTQFENTDDDTTWRQLTDYLKNGYSVRLESDICADGSVYIDSEPGRKWTGDVEIDKKVSLDLNGYTITNETPTSWEGLFKVLKKEDKEGEFTLKNTGDSEKGKITGAESAVYVQEGAVFIMEGGTITGCNASEGKSAIRIDGGTATIKGSSKITDNYATNGGGISVTKGGKLTLEDNAEISNNKAVKDIQNEHGDGGGIYVTEGSNVTVNGGFIKENNALGSGGGISVAGTNNTIIVNGGSIEGNTAAWGGGGIFSWDDSKETTIELNGGFIDKNTASNCGGGIFVHGSTIKIKENAAINENKVTNNDDTVNSGGGIYVEGNSNFSIEGNAEIKANEAKRGGGIRAGGSWGGDVHASFTMEGGNISRNIAHTSEGGGISINDGCTATIMAGTIRNNQTFTTKDWGGGGVFCSDGSTIYLENVLITNNDAGGFGGGLAGCSTGRVFTCGTGGAIYNNRADGTHMAEGSIKTEDKIYGANIPEFINYGFQDYFCAYVSSITNDMLGGGKENWTGSRDGEPVKEGQIPDILSSTYSMGLTAHPTKIPDDELVKVYIQNNSSSTHGGGIMCNGILIIGDTEEVSVSRPVELVTRKEQKIGDKNEALAGGEYTFVVAEDSDHDNKQEINWKKIVLTGWNESDGVITFPGRLVFDEKKWETGEQVADKDDERIFYYYMKEVGGGNGDSYKEGYDATVYKIAIRIKKNQETIKTGAQKTIRKIEFLIPGDEISEEGQESKKEYGITVQKSNEGGQFEEMSGDDESGNLVGYTICTTNAVAPFQDVEKDNYTTIVAFPCTGLKISDKTNPNDATGHGELKEPAVGVTFTNKVQIASAGLNLKGLKVIDGKPSKKAFSFKIEVDTDKTGDISNNVTIPAEYKSVINDKDGVFTFSNISFSGSGTYYLKVEERKPEVYDENINYESKTYMVKVTVGEEGNKYNVTDVAVSQDGSNYETVEVSSFEGKVAPYYKLTAYNAETGENPTFSNTTKAILNLRGLKNLDGKPSKDPFTFSIEVGDETGENADKVTIPAQYRNVQNKTDGVFLFNNISFSEPGTYYLKVSEVEPKNDGKNVNYESKIYTVKVTVEEKEEKYNVTDVEISQDGGNYEKIEVSGSEMEAYYKLTNYNEATGTVPTFNNTTKGILTLKGLKDLNSMPSKDSFTFKIDVDKDATKNANGADAGEKTDKVKIPDQYKNVQNNEDGIFTFDDIGFLEAGTYVLNIREERGTDTSITYDEAVYALTVKVEENSDSSKNELEVTQVSVQKKDKDNVVSNLENAQILGSGENKYYKITNYNETTGTVETFHNKRSNALPETGGFGNLPYTLTGLLLTFGAACLMYIRSRKRKEGSTPN